MEKPDLQICPTCKKQSLFLNKSDNTYECLNQKCSDYHHQFLKISIDRYYEQLEAEKKALDEISNANTHAWVGNQYMIKRRKSGAMEINPFERIKSLHGLLLF